MPNGEAAASAAAAAALAAAATTATVARRLPDAADLAEAAVRVAPMQPPRRIAPSGRVQTRKPMATRAIADRRLNTALSKKLTADMKPRREEL